MAKASNVILVHGAWADGSSWSKVIPLLLARGLRVTAAQLALTSLKDDVATVKRALALEDGPTVLVGHSYGGVVITEAGNDPKVSALVYIAAFAPDAGQSVGSLGASAEPAPMAAEVRPDAQGFLKERLRSRPQPDGKGRPVRRAGTDGGRRLRGKRVGRGLEDETELVPGRESGPRDSAEPRTSDGEDDQGEDD